MRTSIYSNLNARLSDVMKQARLDAGLTQAELARATGRTQAYISKFEHGQLRLDVEDFIAFCDSLKIQPSEVIDTLKGNQSTRSGIKGI
ncbi:helix-turn-helix domain-containing protein [Allomesorhizobium camelthorni]|uniref:Helix-turn-helix domain-containing protein n=1 Tax=Allomesorhizobium camelthorni TaxID=475069 RepID=A0A6G4WHA2_9HYPH|nr:helix-turn-helix transcriptional regulator [Mesorhizobium camelthorni]NGO53477.1 helix-turn-helix domain-containing protein [Mesorhizobium camelthorni]